MKTILAAPALFSATAVSPLLGQGDDESTRMTLTGVHGVRVVVRLSDSAEVQKDGLSQSQLPDGRRNQCSREGPATPPNARPCFVGP